MPLTESFFVMSIRSKIVIGAAVCYALVVTLLLFSFWEKNGALEKEMQEKDVQSVRLLERQAVVMGEGAIPTDSFLSSINERDVLFYRFSEHMCELCIYEDLNILRQLQDSVGYKNILILPSYGESKNSRLRLSNELRGFRYRNIPRDVLPFPIDRELGIETRYLGYIDHWGNIGMCFMPRRNETELTWRYLTLIRQYSSLANQGN